MAKGKGGGFGAKMKAVGKGVAKAEQQKASGKGGNARGGGAATKGKKFSGAF